ncbi:uncharacterized protein [Dermacentor albipictus]|uniref:uncharacterized protein isoform X1 n=1 Tax=Dermacentor albipictus TaxID=60249 RepID=UPI0031FBC431
MTTMKYFNIAVLLALLTVANALNFEVLRKALNTTQKVWLKKRSFPIPDEKCTYASKLFLNQTDYKFRLHYEIGKEKVQQEFFAKFGGGERGEDPWMTVISAGGGTGQDYTLKFASDTEKCGVLTFNLGGMDLCKMYVWDQTVDTTLTECEKNYNAICQESHTVYSSDCKAKSVQNN